MSDPIRVAVSGATGRMGKAVLTEVAADERFALAAALEAPGHPALGEDAGRGPGLGELGVPITDDLAAARADVLIEFTLPEPSLAHLQTAAGQGLSAVVGTTGFSAEARARIDALAGKVPIVLAPNMSVGVNLLFHLAGEAVARLGPGYDLEVFEMHHGRKVDAPSGTAARLAEVAAEARGLGESCFRHGRKGAVGARPTEEIGIHAARLGDVIGEHTLFLAGAGERLELTHRCTSRANFARGALRAAAWLQDQQPGRVYDMQDVLDLR